MKDYTYYYTIDHNAKQIYVPSAVYGLGNPVSHAGQRREGALKRHFGQDYKVSMLRMDSWKEHVANYEIKSIKLSETKKEKK